MSEQRTVLFLSLGLQDQLPLVVRATPLLAELQERLPGPAFVRIHRSYLVAVGRINGFSSREVIMADGSRLRIGRAYPPDFLRLMHGNEPG